MNSPDQSAHPSIRPQGSASSGSSSVRSTSGQQSPREANTPAVSPFESPVSQLADQQVQTRQGDTAAASLVLQVILNAVNSYQSSAKKPQVATTTEGYKEWLSSAIQIYFGRFHERWPLIQHPIFDERTDHTLVVASVVMIGSWFRSPDGPRKSIIDIHDAMVPILMKHIVRIWY